MSTEDAHDHVFLSLADLLGFEKPTDFRLHGGTGWMRIETTMQLFRALDRMKRQYIRNEPTWEEMKKDEFRRRVAIYRPHCTWSEIADSLGVTVVTIHRWREEMGVRKGDAQ